MPSYTAHYFDEPEHQEPSREAPISASDIDEARKIAQEQMLPHEKVVRVDEFADDGRQNMRSSGRPEDQ